MSPIDLLLPATAILTWALGAQLAIWWPNKTTAGSSRARALHATRYAAAGLALGFLAVVLSGLVAESYDRFRFLLAVVAYGTFLQTPLAASALAVTRGERALALIGTILALLLIALFLGYCLLWAILLSEYGTLLQSAVASLAVVLVAGALFSAVELYAAVWPPRAQWDESYPGFL
jgi:hypothetical protein